METGKLRVAIFSDSALPILNGVSISIHALVTELRNLGHSVDIFTASHFSYRDHDPNTYRFPAFRTPWAKNYPLAIPPFYGMLKKFRRRGFDVIHTHTPFTIGYVGLRWGESHDIPVVSTYHTLYDRYAHYIPLPRRYVRFKIAKHTNFYYNNVAHVITPSHAAYRWLRRHSVHTPISVIPTGVPASTLFDRAESRHALGILPSHRILLYVGRLAKEKNLDVLFEAAALAFRQDPNLRLWLVGDGPYRSNCLELVRELNIGDRVRFIGFVPREEVDRYYAASDLFVFSSITETQGLVVQEAMVYGLPAVAIAGGGASAAIENGVNGFVAKNDARHFSGKMLQVAQDAELYEKLAIGAAASVRGSSTGDMAERVLGVYDQVLHRSGSDKRREPASARS